MWVNNIFELSTGWLQTLDTTFDRVVTLLDDMQCQLRAYLFELGMKHW